MRKYRVSNAGSSVAVQETIQSQHIALRPNPASDQLLVEITAKDLGKTIIIRDAQGRIVLEKSANDFRSEMDLRELQAGVYLLSLDQSSLAPVRLVKQ